MYICCVFLQLENVAKEEEGIVVGLYTSFWLVIVIGEASTIVNILYKVIHTRMHQIFLNLFVLRINLEIR